MRQPHKIIAIAVGMCFMAQGAVSAGLNPVMKAPDGFHYDAVGSFTKDLGTQTTIQVPDTWDETEKSDNGAGIHVGALNQSAEKTTVVMTGGSLDIVLNKDNLWQAGVDAFGDSELTLGTADKPLDSLTVKGHGADAAFGFSAWRGHGTNTQTNGGHMVINSRTVDVDITAPYAKGFFVWNNTATDGIEPEKCASVDIHADRVRMVLKSDKTVADHGPSRIFQVWSQGRVSINADDIYLEADELVNTRGHSVTAINGKRVQLKGDVHFAYDGVSSGTVVDADVNIALKGPESYWEGSPLYTYDTKPSAEKLAVSGLRLGLAEGASWTPRTVIDNVAETNGTVQVAVNELTLDQGVINVTGGEKQVVKVEQIKGTGGTVNLKGTLKGDTIETGSLTALKPVTGDMALTVMMVGVTADDIKDVEKAMASFDGKVAVSGASRTEVIQEGAVTGPITQTIDKSGEKGKIEQGVNRKLDGYGSIVALSAIQWRHENDSLLKRMGELRDAQGESGLWVRLYGSEQEYGRQSVKAKNTTVQVGADHAIGSGWTLGGAFAYTDGSATFDAGESDAHMYGFSAYGTWLGENGRFFDVIGKYSRLSNDFSSGVMKGEFDNHAFSLAAEYGRRFAVTDLVFVEPSVGMTYGRILGDTFTSSNGVRVEQDDVDSLIGRVGLRAGFALPKQMGNVYARAAVLHDVMGDAEARASKRNDAGEMRAAQVKEALGGTWVEYGLGANLSLSKTTYMYVDLERTSGGDVDENYRYNLGLRHVF